VGDDRKEVRPRVTDLVDLAAEDQGDLGVDVVGELEVELDENRSVCNNGLANCPIFTSKEARYI
jgi:hypothetical protein